MVVCFPLTRPCEEFIGQSGATGFVATVNGFEDPKEDFADEESGNLDVRCGSFEKGFEVDAGSVLLEDLEDVIGLRTDLGEEAPPTGEMEALFVIFVV